MGVTQSVKDEAKTLTTTKLVQRVSTANKQCTQWKNEVAEMEADEDLGLLGYLPVVAAYGAISGASDELIRSREIRDEKCDLLKFYSAELAKRRAIAPAATAEAESAVYTEQTKITADVRDRGAEIATRDAERTEFGGSKTLLGGAVDTVTGFPERLKEGFFGTFGLGASQPTEERIAGLVRLLLAGASIFFVYKAIGKIAAVGIPVAERAAERSVKIGEKILDSPMPPGLL